MREQCPECGADPFKTLDYDKKSSEMVEIGYRFKQMRASHGMQRAEWELREISLEQSMKWLQQKTRKQAAAIKRLEDKLKKLGQQPYKKDEE